VHETDPSMVARFISMDDKAKVLIVYLLILLVLFIISCLPFPLLLRLSLLMVLLLFLLAMPLLLLLILLVLFMSMLLLLNMLLLYVVVVVVVVASDNDDDDNDDDDDDGDDGDDGDDDDGDDDDATIVATTVYTITTFAICNSCYCFYWYFCFSCCAILFGGRGRTNILPVDVYSKASDHDFPVVSLIQSVTLVVNFDGSTNNDEDENRVSFYRGSVHVCVKDSIFQSSNAKRHVVELISLLDTMPNSCPVLFNMTDGGPDHNCRQLAVQMVWLDIFLKVGMDMLVVSRVAPTRSWTNTAERVIGPNNLAF